MDNRSTLPLSHSTPPARRDFLRTVLGAVASLGASGAVSGCATAESASDCPSDGTTKPFDYLAATPDGALDVSGLPLRQDDPAWGAEVMWDRDLVIQAATELDGYSTAEAALLLREFDDGNNIANEGCMLTCLARVLRLLAAPASPPWTPRTLNDAAHEALYYSLSGLSMTTLYADLVAEVTGGAVQLCLKEEYLPGEPGWPRMRASSSALVRAYRTLSPEKRANFVVMLKTGTYDDTVASHYVLLHPNDAGSVDDDDVTVLDPAMPADAKVPWRLSDSAKVITEDPDIAAGWQDAAIEPTQLGGAWVFVRWGENRDRSLLAPLVHAWASELSTRST